MVMVDLRLQLLYKDNVELSSTLMSLTRYTGWMNRTVAGKVQPRSVSMAYMVGLPVNGTTTAGMYAGQHIVLLQSIVILLILHCLLHVHVCV